MLMPYLPTEDELSQMGLFLDSLKCRSYKNRDERLANIEINFRNLLKDYETRKLSDEEILKQREALAYTE